MRGALAALAMLLLVVVVLAGARVVEWGRRLWRPAEPTITHDLVLQQLQDVAKLVSTEMTLRDVVVFDQSRLIFRKRMLLVVTGKVLAGVDLKRGTDVRIDHRAKLITIVLPPAEVLAVDVIDMRTYDEQAGLLDPFSPADRDAIQRQVRAQLVAAGNRSGLLPHADSTARQVLRELLAKDGYTVLVLSPRQLVLPKG
ncbi:MAG: DUF4230 domain-containing protein [Gemmatimonadaceae bacterium]